MAILRVGVIVDGSERPAWQARLLCALRATAAATLIVACHVSPAPPVARLRAFRLYERLDSLLFAPPDDADARVDVSEILESLPQIELAGLTPAANSHEPDAAAIGRLRALRPDVLLQLGGPAFDGEVLDVARLGLWSFAHEDGARRGTPPFWDEMASGASVVESRLLARRRDGETTLYRSWSNSNPNSLVRQRHPVLWKSAAFVERALRGFAEGREPPFDGGGTARAEPRPAIAPTLPGVGRFAARAVTRVLRNRRRIRRADRVWFIALRRRRANSLVGDALDGFEALPCPTDRFHADPMLIRDGDAHHLFFEDAERENGIGRIAWRPIDAGGRAGASEIVLEARYHLSYPFVFRWRDAFYMIPETSENRTVELYRATEFPRRWELEKVLLHDVIAADPTLVEHEGRFWLFLAMSPTGASLNDELFLLHAETPLGPWTSHPWNPIVSDVRRARPAGPVFRDAGALWRPGQDCSGDYGAAFWLNRIERLDPDGYRETPVRRIDPSWLPGGLCTHTYTRAGDFEAMDNRVWKPR